MPIVASTITSAILIAGPTLRGSVWAQLAAGIGFAVQAWAVVPSNIVLVGFVSGVVGGGSVTGKFSMSPAPLPVGAAVAAAGLVGPSATEVAAAVGLGVGAALNASATYAGTATGAIGADVSRVITVNPATLITLLVSSFAAQGIVGPLAGQLATGLGNGIATMILTGGGTGVAVGAAGPSPGTGVSRSGLI